MKNMKSSQYQKTFNAIGLTFASALLLCLTSPTHAAITPSGDLDPANPATWTSNTTGYIGKTSTGTITVDSASTLLSKNGYLGYNFGSTGLATVTGIGSTWSNSGNLYVGGFGEGTLNIQAGGQVSNPLFIYMGNDSGSSGSITVNGIGSKLTSQYGLYVGNKGTGTLKIEEGGQVSNSNLDSYLGYDYGSIGTATITGAGSLWDNNGNLSVGNKGTGTLNIEAGGIVENFSGSLGDYSGSTGTATVTGVGSSWKNDYFLNIGETGSGTLNIQEGGRVYSSAGTLGVGSGAVGTTTITGAGSFWHSDVLNVGGSGTGTLKIEAGGEVNASSYIGQNPGSFGKAIVSGAGSSLGGGSLYIGCSGTGVLIVEAGGQISSTSGELALNSGSSGTVTVTGTNSKWINSSLNIGYAGVGELNIANGAQVSGGTYGCDIGFKSGSNGTISITGANSMLTNGSSLSIGTWGTGVLKVEAGGQVSNASCFLGFNSGSSGTAKITGNGSTWKNNGDLYIGNSGAGTVIVEAGGQVSNTSGRIGSNSGSSGTVKVTGAGSKWTNSSFLYVGDLGAGVLNIEAGGQVSNTYCYLGYNSGSSGSATVTGIGSKWNNSGDLYVGKDGVGSLTVKDGGSVVVDGSIYAPSLLGNGTVSAKGGIVDANLVFDAAHGLQGSSNFGSGGTLTIDQSASNPLGVGYKGTGSMQINAGVTVTSKFGYLGYYAGSVGTATVAGTGAKWNNPYNLYVGYDGSGSLAVNEGGTVVVGCTLFSPLNSLSGNGTISANGGVLDADLVFDAAHGTHASLIFGSGGILTINQTSVNSLGVGYKGNGTLKITGGVTLNCSYGYLGYYAGSNGTATVAGAGSIWHPNDDLYVGYNGSGTLTVDDGGKVFVNKGIYASVENLSGNGTISANGGVLDADLVFDAAHGTHVSLNFGSGGTLTINQASGLALGVGYKGNGTLRIEGVRIPSSLGYLGYNSGSTGTATVTGAGSAWTTNGSLFVGNSGAGSLNVEAGGQVLSFANCFIGRNPGSTGTVTVSGAGSNWTSSNSMSPKYELHVGTYGSGTMMIDARGQVSNDRGLLGYYSGSSGTVTVTGAGSAWTVSDSVCVGAAGAGTLNIGSGIASDGMVLAKSVMLANYGTASATCNLNGGTLQTAKISKGSGTAAFNWNDGVIRNYNSSNDLVVDGANSLVLELSATGTHAFYIDALRTGTVSSKLRDATSGGTLEKQGNGLLTLSNVNTYTGGTTIAAGTLALTSIGALASSPIDVRSGATFDVAAKNGYSIAAGKTLTGSGTIVGDLSISGIHSPGNSIGIETVKGNYSMLGELQIELAGTTAGIGYDQVLLSRSGTYKATLGGTLSLDWTSFTGSTDTTQLWILKNDTYAPLSGTFSNYANGASLGFHDGRSWYLYYNADAATGKLTGGNDVLIAPVPEPATILLLAVAALAMFVWRRKI